MPTSPLVKKVLGKNESIRKKFSLSKQYLKIKLIMSLVTSAVVWAILAFVLHFSQNTWQQFLPLGINTGYTDFSSINYDNLNALSSSPNFDFGPLWWLMIGVFLVIIVPILFFYHLFYLKISNEYIFTNQRIIVKRGWIGTKTISIHYNRITDVSITQSLIDRLLGIGALAISTAGQEGYHIILSHIAKPHQLKKELFDLKEHYLQNLYKQGGAVNDHGDY